MSKSRKMPRLSVKPEPIEEEKVVIKEELVTRGKI
jgi:hypothetical protein